MKELPKRQKETYEYIKAFISSHGYSPTQEEIAQHFLVSQITVKDCLETLKEKKLINYFKGKPRTISITNNTL